MSDKMTDDEVTLYCLHNLAGYESSDIDGDDVDIAVNDDQFASVSIVNTARLGAALIERQNLLIAKQAEQLNIMRHALTEIKNTTSARHDECSWMASVALEATKDQA